MSEYDFDQPRVMSSSELTAEALARYLTTSDYSALVVPNFISPRVAKHLADAISGSTTRAGYFVEPTFEKDGAAWFEQDSDSKREQHLANTIKYSDAVIERCYPYAPPTDTLKVRLDLLWPAGVFNQRIGDRPLYYGLPRSLKPSGEVCAHFDYIGHDSPGARGIEGIKRQIAVNFYVQNAETGGEIALWDGLDATPDQLAKFRIPDHAYGLDETLLGPPTVTLRPPERSLVLFDATKPHAVRKSGGARERVTFSAFLGYFGPRFPLTLWS